MVTVTPSVVSSLPIGSSITLAASVDADAGVSSRTVTWTSSDATVASVGTDGKVTGVKAGTVTITAAATADPNVKGAAVVTVVAGANGAVPTVTISTINQTNAQGQSVPANLANVAGQLDVTLNVDANGGTIRSITATLKCGNDSVTNTQTVSAAAVAVAADAAAAPVTLSFNTAQFSPAGVAALHNGACTVSSQATSTSGVQSAVNSTAFTLNNADAVLITTSFAGGATAADANGLPWKSGAVTVAATPVLYNANRSIFSLTIALPGTVANATPAGQDASTSGGTITSKTSPAITTATAGAYSFTFQNSTSGSIAASQRVGQTTMTGVGVAINGFGQGIDALGFPVPVTPAVIAIDNAGNDLPLAVLNAGAASFRLDNQSPVAPLAVQVPVRQQGWINGSYTFTGTGGAAGGQTTKYMSGSDNGVSDVTAVSGNTGVNGNTTFTYFYKPASQFSVANDQLTNGTSTGTANCVTTAAGYTQITTGADLAATQDNLQYVIRVLEADKLGNVRCSDLGTGVNTAGFTIAKIGVDKVAPTAALLDAANAQVANPATANQAVAIGGTVPTFAVALSDNASGFSATPLTTTVTRLAIDPSTGVASTSNTAFGCPIGFNAGNGTCAGTATGSTVTGFDQGDGYYTFTATALDLARNAAPVLTRTIVIDRAAPTVGGIAVPATIVGGQSASFATSATDNLDLVSSDYSLQFANNVANSLQPTFSIRTPGPALGVAFDNVLTTSASFNVVVPTFIRNLQVTNAAGAPQAAAGLPTAITIRAYDAANNVGSSGAVAINAPNVPQTTPTVFSVAQANGAQFLNFQVSNVAANISNCPAAGCAGNAAPANPTSISLTATATGSEGANFQFTNPFTQVQFYYYDGSVGEYRFIGAAVAPIVTDNAGVTQRTFTWTLGTAFDPPASMGTGQLYVVAIGIAANGDALASAANNLITLTNP